MKKMETVLEWCMSTMATVTSLCLKTRHQSRCVYVVKEKYAELREGVHFVSEYICRCLHKPQLTV